MKPHEIHQELRKINLRIFNVKIDEHEMSFIAHRTIEQWREDIRRFRNTSERQDKYDGWAQDKVFNDLISYMTDLGYVEVDDVVSDVFEGRVATTSAQLVDYPDHENQKDGFGHYGWESKNI